MDRAFREKSGGRNDPVEGAYRADRWKQAGD